MHPTRQTLSIGPPRCEEVEQRYRVTAEVDGQPVWFEASIPLVPAPEAFAGLFWIPVLHNGRRLAVETPLDPQWLANVHRTLPILHQWWGYPQQNPLADAAAGKWPRPDSGSDVENPTGLLIGQPSEESAVRVAHPPLREDSLHRSEEPGPRRATGLCFSGGTDSFYSLLRGTHPIDTLICAHGFDIPYDDWPRMQHLERALQEVAAATSKRLIIVRTNIRTHHYFKQLNWERTHGAAIVALGHVLSNTLNHLVIASSYQYQDEHPWGSNWRLDPLWSSSRLSVLHDDATFGRQGKVARIADHELVQRHLLVCWSRRSVAGNCGDCEKCIRTMVTLESVRRLPDFTAFPRSAPLPQLIDALAPLSPHLHPIWSRLRQKLRPSPIADAADRLLARSDPSVSHWTRRWRGLRHSLEKRRFR